MDKKIAIVLVALFAIIGLMGIYMMIPEPVTVVRYEKIVICKDGICDISVLRNYSDGSGAGTESTVPQEWYDADSTSSK